MKRVFVNTCCRRILTELLPIGEHARGPSDPRSQRYIRATSFGKIIAERGVGGFYGRYPLGTYELLMLAFDQRYPRFGAMSLRPQSTIIEHSLLLT